MPTAWEVDTAVYEEKFKFVGDEDVSPRGIFFKPDGLKMYIMGNISKTVYQYTLSTPWEVDTATYEEKFKVVTPEEDSPRGIWFKPDGSIMYIVGTSSDKVYQYTVNTPWDVSTAVYADKFKNVAPEDITPADVMFNPDGSKMYVLGYSGDKVYQYTVNTPWDVSTAVYASKFAAVGTQLSSPQGVFFHPDGSIMYVVGETTDTVFQYTLDTPWDVSTAVYADKFKNVYPPEFNPNAVFFKPDGFKMYIVGRGYDTVFQFILEEEAPAGQPFTLRRRDRYIGGVVR